MTSDHLKELIDAKAEELHQEVTEFRNSMVRSLEALKTDEILTAINGLSNRISALENRLPESEDAD